MAKLAMYPVAYRKQSAQYQTSGPGVQGPAVNDNGAPPANDNFRLPAARPFIRIAESVARVHPVIRAAATAYDLYRLFRQYQEGADAPPVGKLISKVAYSSPDCGPYTFDGPLTVCPNNGRPGIVEFNLGGAPGGQWECGYYTQFEVVDELGNGTGECEEGEHGASRLTDQNSVRGGYVPFAPPGHWPLPWRQPVAQPKVEAPPVPYRGRVHLPDVEGLRESGYEPPLSLSAALQRNAERAVGAMPLAPRSPPGPGVRERKLRAVQRVGFAIANHVTETHDALNCLWSSIPADKRSPIVGRKLGKAGPTMYPPLSGAQWRALAAQLGKNAAVARTGAYYNPALDAIIPIPRVAASDPAWARYNAGKPVHQTYGKMAADIGRHYKLMDAYEAGKCAFLNELVDDAIGKNAPKSTGLLPRPGFGPAL